MDCLYEGSYFLYFFSAKSMSFGGFAPMAVVCIKGSGRIVSDTLL